MVGFTANNAFLKLRQKVKHVFSFIPGKRAAEHCVVTKEK